MSCGILYLERVHKRIDYKGTSAFIVTGKKDKAEFYCAVPSELYSNAGKVVSVSANAFLNYNPEKTIEDCQKSYELVVDFNDKIFNGEDLGEATIEMFESRFAWTKDKVKERTPLQEWGTRQKVNSKTRDKDADNERNI